MPRLFGDRKAHSDPSQGYGPNSPEVQKLFDHLRKLPPPLWASLCQVAQDEMDSPRNAEARAQAWQSAVGRLAESPDSRAYLLGLTEATLRADELALTYALPAAGKELMSAGIRLGIRPGHTMPELPARLKPTEAHVAVIFVCWSVRQMTRLLVYRPVLTTEEFRLFWIPFEMVLPLLRSDQYAVAEGRLEECAAAAVDVLLALTVPSIAEEAIASAMDVRVQLESRERDAALDVRPLLESVDGLLAITAREARAGDSVFPGSLLDDLRDAAGQLERLDVFYSEISQLHNGMPVE
jgi:hypothetical protein